MQSLPAILATLIAIVAILAIIYVAQRAKGADPQAAAMALAEILVRAAEQTIPDPEDRRDYVIDLLRQKFPNVDGDLLIAIIESAVYDVNQEQAMSGTATPRSWTMTPGDDDSAIGFRIYGNN